LDGEQVAERHIARLRRVVATFSRAPHLAIVLVGRDPASVAYVRQKELLGARIGIRVSVHRPKERTTARVASFVRQLSRNQKVDALIVQLPLSARLDTLTILEAIDPTKDVDGLHPLNRGYFLAGTPLYIPPTPLGILELLDFYRVRLSGKRVVIVGRGALVGKPLAMLLMDRGALVTWAHRKTPDLTRVTREADVIVMATGVPRLLTSSMVRRGAVVIDAGWTRLGGKICGNVDFASVARRAGALTPVPGGVGPMTVVSLMENVIKAYRANRLTN
jgi:methylenetetrahydrofolate dehydrogenase (NADP+)/methenyltetrahydrofolate cyclohydrolase